MKEFTTRETGRVETTCNECRAEVQRIYRASKPSTPASRAANRDRTRKHRRLRQDFVDDIKRQRGCRLCREATPCVLVFHHVYPNSKTGEVGQMVQRLLPVEEIAKEIAKCVVLCSNCHLKLHEGLVSLPTEVLLEYGNLAAARRVVVGVRGSARRPS